MDKWSKKRRIMQRYDATAHIYDMRYAEEQTAKIKTALKNIKLTRRNYALDVGCGTGILFDHVADKVDTIVGLDISRKMLVKARDHAHNFQNVCLVAADADNMPLRDASFERVFAFTLIQNLPDPARTLEEIKRVAEQNALFVVTGLKKSFNKESFKRLLCAAGLRIVGLEEEDLKCYVATCVRFSH